MGVNKFTNRDDNEGVRESLTKGDLVTDQNKATDPNAVSDSFDSKKIFGNIVSLGSSEIVARSVAFIGVTYLARKLGPEGFGIIGFAVALFGYLALAVTAGFNDIGSREVARRPYEASSIAVSVIIMRLVLASIALLSIGIVAWCVDKPPTVKLVVALMGLLFFSLALDTSWVYKGLERNRPVGVALILSQVLYVGTVLLVVKGPKDVTLVPLAQFLGEVSTATLLAIPILRLGGIKLDIREGLSILKSSSLRAAARLMRTLMYTFDVVLIGFLLGEREVGLYTAPYRLCFLLVAIAVAIYSSYLPAITRALDQDIRQVEYIAERSINLASAISAPIIVGGMILATPLLQAVFGPDYLEGAGAFRLLILSTGFIFIHGAIHNIMLACDRMKLEMLIFTAAAGLNIGLNLIIIPSYGIAGAAFVTALAEGLLLVMMLFAIYKMNIRLDFRPIFKPLLSAGVMAASLMALGSGGNLALYLGVGFVVYILALFAFRGIPQDAQPHLRNLALFANNLRVKFWRA